MQVRSLIVSALLVLSQAACGGGGEAALGESPTLSGQIQGWTEGAGYSLSVTTQSIREVATGTIDASGAFSVKLPGGEVMAQYLQPALTTPSASCSQLPQTSPASLRGAGITLQATKMGSSSVPLQRTSASAQGGNLQGLVAANYVYAEADGSISGRLECSSGPNGSTTGDYAVNLRKGWNVLVTTVRSFSLTPIRVDSEIHTGSEPPETSWRKSR